MDLTPASTTPTQDQIKQTSARANLPLTVSVACVTMWHTLHEKHCHELPPLLPGPPLQLPLLPAAGAARARPNAASQPLSIASTRKSRELSPRDTPVHRARSADTHRSAVTSALCVSCRRCMHTAATCQPRSAFGGCAGSDMAQCVWAWQRSEARLRRRAHRVTASMRSIGLRTPRRSSLKPRAAAAADWEGRGGTGAPRGAAGRCRARRRPAWRAPRRRTRHTGKPRAAALRGRHANQRTRRKVARAAW
jgi:hypothetical protein